MGTWSRKLVDFGFVCWNCVYCSGSASVPQVAEGMNKTASRVPVIGFLAIRTFACQ